MPYENCDNCKKCLPCPVTRVDESEGAYPISQDAGNVWYCTSCFYCEDVCPDYSPRQYAIDKRRNDEQSSQETQEPLKKLKENGTLFPITNSINSLRVDLDLPKMPLVDTSTLKILYDIAIRKEKYSSKVRKKRISSKNKIAIFLGCLIPYRVFDYEKSAREILKTLDIEVIDLPFACCGSVMTESFSEDLWLASAAYNFALAEEYGVNIILSLCGGCSGNLRRVNQEINSNPDKLILVNSYLSSIDKYYSGKIKNIHFTEFLLNDENQQKISSKIIEKKNDDLNKIKVGTQVPCQVIRPKDSVSNFDVDSNLISAILKLTEINVISYPFETMCCGSSMLIHNEKIAHGIGLARINSLLKREVDALVVGCGNCSMNLSVHQSSYTNAKLPILFFTEIISYVLGNNEERVNELLENLRK